MNFMNFGAWLRQFNPKIVLRRNGDCWEPVYPTARDRDGYVVFHESTESGQKWWNLHRFVRFKLSGVDKGTVVRHTCDNRACVRPKHLVTGTCQDNVDDRQARQRSARGSRVGTAVLTERKAKLIFQAKGSQDSIAKKFNISQRTVSSIKRLVTWAHVNTT